MTNGYYRNISTGSIFYCERSPSGLTMNVYYGVMDIVIHFPLRRFAKSFRLAQATT
jgi:hypothetical protein